MKRLFALLFAFGLGLGSYAFFRTVISDRKAEASPFVESVSFKGADWDSLAIPLGIKPYYLKIESKQRSKGLSLEMDLHQNGAFVKTISGSKVMALVNDELSLASEFAIHFKPVSEGVINGVIVMQAGGNRGTSFFQLQESEFPSSGASSFGAFETPLETPRRNPVFYIIAGAKALQFANTPKDLIAANPEATVVIGYLNAE